MPLFEDEKKILLKIEDLINDFILVAKMPKKPLSLKEQI
jgi:hypothetical protein